MSVYFKVILDTFLKFCNSRAFYICLWFISLIVMFCGTQYSPIRMKFIFMFRDLYNLSKQMESDMINAPDKA